MVAGKCQPSLGSVSSRGCVSPCVGGYWCFTECLSGETHLNLCMSVCPCAVPPAGDRRTEGVGFNPCVCMGSFVCQLGSQHRALQHQPWLSFLPSVTYGRREDVAESCNSRSKHTAALKIRAKAFLYKHMVLFILLFSLSNAYLPLWSSFQPQGKKVSLGGKLG